MSYRNRFVWLLSMIAVFLGVTSLSLAQEPPHWEYEGEAGPEHWGDLDPSFVLCSAGEGQSPIDLTGAAELNLTDIEFAYSASAMNIFNNGHTIQVNYDSGSSITYNEATYDLVQFHFHHPSEHTINGQAGAMEIHFVHRDAAGNLAVVGVMLMEGEADNAAYAAIFDELPTEAGDPTAVGEINAADLLPEGKTFYTYSGSLTTPPCSQGVRWLVLTDPITLSAAQIEAFTSIFELNARPVQTLNQRDLLLDSE